jgi:hypothetical protein
VLNDVFDSLYVCMCFDCALFSHSEHVHQHARAELVKPPAKHDSQGDDDDGGEDGRAEAARAAVAPAARGTQLRIFSFTHSY